MSWSEKYFSIQWDVCDQAVRFGCLEAEKLFDEALLNLHVLIQKDIEWSNYVLNHLNIHCLAREPAEVSYAVTQFFINGNVEQGQLDDGAGFFRRQSHL